MKIIIKIPPRCHQNAGNGLQKSQFSWGGMPPTPPPLEGRAYTARGVPSAHSVAMAR